MICLKIFYFLFLWFQNKIGVSSWNVSCGSRSVVRNLPVRVVPEVSLRQLRLIENLGSCVYGQVLTTNTNIPAHPTRPSTGGDSSGLWKWGEAGGYKLLHRSTINLSRLMDRKISMKLTPCLPFLLPHFTFFPHRHKASCLTHRIFILPRSTYMTLKEKLAVRKELAIGTVDSSPKPSRSLRNSKMSLWSELLQRETIQSLIPKPHVFLVPPLCRVWRKYGW